VKLTNIFAALACALTVLSLASCGAFQGQTNDLQSITLGASLINGQPPSGQSGFFNLEGLGGTIQLQAIGNYTDKKTKDLTHQVKYTIMVDPLSNVDAFNFLLLPPCTGSPCPFPVGGPYTNGTVELDVTGLVTATEPAVCTWVDLAPLLNGEPQPPSWYYSGDYVVTASFEGITSQPVYIPVASSAGNPYYPPSEGPPYTNPGNAAYENNPTSVCGPTSGG